MAHGSPSRSAADERALQELLGLLQVGVDVDRDVAEEPQGQRQRERVVLCLAQRLRPRRAPRSPLGTRRASSGPRRDRRARGPRARPTSPRGRPCASARSYWSTAARLSIRRRARSPAQDQLVDGAIGDPPVERVEVERRARGELQVFGRERVVAQRDQPVGDRRVQSHPLALRQAPVRHVAQHRVAHAPVRRPSALLADHDLGLLELVELVGRDVRVDAEQLVEVERVPEDRRAPGRACGAAGAGRRAGR